MPLTGKIKNLFEDKDMTISVFPRTKVKAISDDNGVGLGALLDAKADKTELDAKADKTELDNKQEKHETISVSLTTSKWSNLAQSVTVTGVTASNAVVVTPAPASHTAYCESGVYCSAQANGTLTFKCSTVPSANLIVNVLVLN